jgi:squalene synthase HpnC
MVIQQQAARSRENFPVASILLPAHARAPILALYDFARGADNIADDPGQSPAMRAAQLQVLMRGEYSQPWAQSYAALVQQGLLSAAYGNQLLSAFLLDTSQSRYATYEDLIAYCRLSAAPVGRAVLNLCRENDADLDAADALCMVLQILNHIQDMRHDYVKLNRIYLPQQWLQEYDVAETDLGAESSSEGLQALIRRLLVECDHLLEQAQGLAPTIQSRRLRMEINVIWHIAARLRHQLEHDDPLSRHIRLTRMQYAGCLWRGVMRGIKR